MKPFSVIANILLLVMLTQCTTPEKTGNDKSVEPLQTVLDSLQKIYAPDRRIKLWHTDIALKDKRVHVIITTNDKKAGKVVETVLKKRFPDIKSLVKILPVNDNGMIADALANNSVINLRTAPHHSAELATQVLLGTPLKILETGDEWYLVQTPNKYIAWTDDDAIVALDSLAMKKYKESRKVVFNKMCGFSYSLPDRSSPTVSDLVMGCILPVKSEKNNFLRVSYPDGRMAWILKNDAIDLEELINKKPESSEIVKTAEKFNGLPYLWGGTSPKAVDCSGFTYTVYFMNGLILQRDASQQTLYGKEVSTIYDYRYLQPGDLLFFGRPASGPLPEKVTHVALYIGNSMFIHASGKVRINSMDSTNPRFIDSYPARFVRARRIIGFEDGFGIQNIADNEFYKTIIGD